MQSHRWLDAGTQQDCLVTVHPMTKVWSAYVGVDVGHPLYNDGKETKKLLYGAESRIHYGLDFGIQANQAGFLDYIGQHVYWIGNSPIDSYQAGLEYCRNLARLLFRFRYGWEEGRRELGEITW